MKATSLAIPEVILLEPKSQALWREASGEDFMSTACVVRRLTVR